MKFDDSDRVKILYDAAMSLFRSKRGMLTLQAVGNNWNYRGRIVFQYDDIHFRLTAVEPETNVRKEYMFCLGFGFDRITSFRLDIVPIIRTWVQEVTGVKSYNKCDGLFESVKLEEYSEAGNHPVYSFESALTIIANAFDSMYGSFCVENCIANIMSGRGIRLTFKSTSTEYDLTIDITKLKISIMKTIITSPKTSQIHTADFDLEFVRKDDLSALSGKLLDRIINDYNTDTNAKFKLTKPNIGSEEVTNVELVQKIEEGMKNYFGRNKL